MIGQNENNLSAKSTNYFHVPVAWEATQVKVLLEHYNVDKTFYFSLICLARNVTHNVIIAERVYKPRTNLSALTIVGFNSELCPDGLVICGWHARLGQSFTQ